MTTNARLRALVELAETGSVRAAAARLVVTESSVSAAARGKVDPERGLLRPAAVTVGEHVVPLLLASFRSRHPGVTLRLEVAHRDRVWPLLVQHDVDLVVAGRPPQALAVAIRAVSPNLLVVVGPPAEAVNFVPARSTWLMREPGSGTRDTCHALLAALGVDPPQLTLGSQGAVIAAAEAGLGVTLASSHAVARHLADGTLVELPMPGPRWTARGTRSAIRTRRREPRCSSRTCWRDRSWAGPS